MGFRGATSTELSVHSPLLKVALCPADIPSEEVAIWHRMRQPMKRRAAATRA
jgi:hypothetical protein